MTEHRDEISVTPNTQPIGASNAQTVQSNEELLEERRINERRTDALANSLSLLTATLESTADGIVAMDLAGNIISMNSKFGAIWRLPKDVLQWRNSREMMNHAAQQSQDPAEFLQIIENHLANPKHETFHLIKMKDGRVLERYGSPQCVNEKCVGVVVNVREVTERVRAEAAVRESEEKYRLLWSTAGDAFVLFGRDNIIIEANAAVANVFGYQPHEVIGKDLAMLQPERLREGHRRGIQRYLDSGKRVLDWRAAEALGLHRDGHEVPVEIAFNHLNFDGKDLFAGFIRDITERKQAEKSLAMFAAIVDSSHDAIISKTLEGIITSWNRGAEHIFGYSAEEMIGRPLLTIIPPERVDEEPQILARQARGEKIEDLETIRVRKDGTRIHVSITISPIRDSHGTIVGISKIARDITERKAAEAERAALLALEKKAREEAEVANRLKDEFLATLSHELRTPLNAILGWARLVSDERLSEQERNQGLETIQRNALLQSQLVEDILDVSRIVTGKLRLDVEPVDLTTVIDNAVQSVLPAATAKEIRLQRVLDSGNSLVSGDSSRLQQVVWNLLSNAIKFTPKKGRVQIRLERVNSHIEIIVTDTGVGIPTDVLPYVFDRFRQADQSTTRNFGGLGLGLAIVRHIVENHGGLVEAASDGENRGATFTVKLPLIATRSTHVGPELAETRVHPTASRGAHFKCPPELEGLRVLVVDDDQDARHLLKTVLESCGATVLTASNAEEALRYLSKHHPDVLISDLGMPDEDGYSLIQKVRELPATQGGTIPAAALTAYARIEDRLKVLRAGFQIHMTKPIEPAELVTVVANLANRAHHSVKR